MTTLVQPTLASSAPQDESPDRAGGVSSLQRDARYLWHPWSPTRVTPETILAVKGQGCEIVDEGGHRYLDAKSSGLNATLGYGCRPIIEAATQQLETLMTYDLGEGASLPSAILAERIAQLTGQALTRTFFCNSGSEAVEAALRIARFHYLAGGDDARHVIVSLDRAYHGATMGAAAATGGGAPSAQVAPPGFEHVPTPMAGQASEQQATEAVQRLFAAHGARIAAFIVEPVSARTARPLSKPYLQTIRDLSTQHGALMIVDEVTTGFGRTGAMFAYETADLVPDIVCTSKGLGAGYASIGAVTTSEDIFTRFESAKHSAAFVNGHTHSGHATACATGIAVLQYLQEHHVLANVTARHDQIFDGLADALRSEVVVGLHGRGLLNAIEFTTSAAASAVREHMVRSGVLVRRTGRNVLIAPPLIIDTVQTEQLLQACRKAIASVTAASPW